MMASAYLLVAHGSRDPHYQLAVESLAQQVANHIQTIHQPTLVGTACLELASIPLYEQILSFATLAGSQGFCQVDLLPLFLLPGVHVSEDIPHQVELACQAIQAKTRTSQEGTIVAHPPIQLNLLPYLGQCPQLVQVLASLGNSMFPPSPQSSTTSPTSPTQRIGKILLSHGSRRPGSNQPVEKLAQQLGAIAAYWSVSPSLETQLQIAVQQGFTKIVVLPYVLFAGSLTIAIANQIEQLRQQFPHIEIALAPPIATHPQLPVFLGDWLLAISC